MTLKHFIERPVLASVISIVIVIAGIIGLATLPIEQYPDIAPPTVMVRASYPGASAETIQKSVIVPLEQAINGVENMTYITSSAAVGSASVTVYFRQGTDPDMAAVNVQNKVSRATGQLPSAVTQIGVSTMKRQTSMVKIFSLYSPDDSYDETFLSNYSKINIEPRILRIPGVGEAFTLGADYSMRVWLKPDVMAQYKLIPSDVTAALSEQNIESATGTLGENSENTFQYTMKYRGRYETPEEFGQIVIRSLPDGEVLRLKDVADIELGSESYAYKGYTNGHPGVSTMIFQTAGSNATQVVEDVEALLEEVRAELPKGIEIAHLQSVNDFLYASMNEVLKTLIEAIILVVLVVYVFLQDIRSTLVPTISILVALVGTFAFLSVAGFSINLLTLFALVLAIGTVVDDAIIVVEAVQARFDVGYKSSYHATIDAMSGITSAIVTSTLVFMAVFIPVAMMGGTSGIFYTQFGITMAVAVGISAVNALTLSPALCALLLKPYMDENGQMRDNFAARFRKAFNTTFGTMVNKYKHGVLLFIKHKWLMWSTLGLALVALVILMDTTKTGLVPDEDQGTIMVNVTAAPGSGLAETHQIMEQVAERIQTIPQIRDFMQVAGYGMIAGQGSSYGMCIIKLKDWEERPEKSDAVQAVIGQIYARTADIKDAQIFAVAPPMISGYGTSTGFSLNLQDKAGGELTDFYNIYLKFIGALNQRPEIERAYSTFNINFPQYLVDIDAAKAKRAGVSPSTVLSTLAGYYGGQYVSNINRFSKMYYVTLQADPKYRLDTESLNNVYVRTDSGEMAPLSQFVKLTRVYSSEVLNRFNLQLDRRERYGRQRLFVGRRHPGDPRGRRRGAAEGLRIRVRRHHARGGADRQQHGHYLRYLYSADLPHPECALREFLRSVRRHPRRTVRSDRLVPHGQGDGTRKQHLSPNGYHHADRSAVENGHSDHRVRRRPPRRRHEPHASRRVGRQSPSAPDSDDRSYVRVRYDPADALARCRRQRQLHARFGRRGRHDRRYAGAAVPGTYALHRLPDLAGEDQAGGVHLSRLVHPGRDRRESKRTY